MRRIILISLYVIFCMSSGYSQNVSQNVISSAGGQIQYGNGDISWTIGEVVITSIYSSKYILTQGFHQGNYLITSIGEIGFDKSSILLYPNPTRNFINVKIKADSFIKYKYELIDVAGRLLISNLSYTDMFKINLEPYKPAIYYLRISDYSGKFMGSYKIVKQGY